MNRAAPLAILLILTMGCSQEPVPKEAEKAAVANTAEDTADAVKAEKKSIEEAADAAVKLVEEESRQDIEALDTANAQ